jgi:restriction endonuclease Mrr
MEQENKTVVTRAEKKDATKQIIRELLDKKTYKSGELIDEASTVFTAKFGGEENPNDVKGRIGSVIDVMKKDGEIVLKKGVYSLKTVETVATPPTPTTGEEKVERIAKPRAKKKEMPAPKQEEVKEESKQAQPKKTRKTAKKKEEKETTEQPVEDKQAEEKTQPLPTPPLQPIAPTPPVTPETAPEPIPEKKKRGRKAKKEEVAVVEPTVKEEKESVEKVVEEQPKAEEKPAPAPQGTLMDMSFLFGDIKPKKEEPKRLAPVNEPKQIPAVAESKTEVKEEKKVEEKPVQKRVETPKVPVRRTASKPQTADERLCEAFLKRIRKLGGEYFEYFSVYLIEKYSRMSGRRLEGLKISGGEHDGGIDGEIELTDRMGFRETIYIQSKNWNPEKGDERLWVVGETLLQQFIGACACRQARDRKQHSRGIFITTSRFTPEAKKVLDDMSDKIVGYDGEDLFETAKECGFGIIKKNGEYVLDETLLSGERAFFFMG